MDDLGVIVYIIAAIVYGIYSARKKAKKKKAQQQKKAGKSAKSAPQNQPQADQPGRSLEEILKELYPDAQDKPQQKPAETQTRRQEPQTIENRPDLNRRIEEAERLLNDPSARRLDLPDIDPVAPPVRKKDKINVDFDLRQAIIAKVILDRPYK